MAKPWKVRSFLTPYSGAKTFFLLDAWMVDAICIVSHFFGGGGGRTRADHH